MKLKIGSRESELAIVQAKMLMDSIKAYDENIELELITMKTTGDILLDKTLDKIGGKGLFIKELERALLNNEIDLCVHSYKDMPMDIDDRLPIVALSEREEAFDVLILPEGIKEIDFTKPIGSSSARRSIQFNELYPQAIIEPIRGNIITRLRKLDSGEFGALILAYAGIKRLNLSHRIFKVFSYKEIMPAASQGILAVQGRSGKNYDYLQCFNREKSILISKAERAFIKELDGGCSTPTAAYAVLNGGRVLLNGMYVNELTGEIKKDSLCVKSEYATFGGIALANRLKYGTIGKVTLVGAGPYDKGLITVKGLAAIKESDCILYDRLINPLLLQEASAYCEKIDVGKQSSNHRVTQDEINRMLLEKALIGKNVVRLKGGDSFVFGRGAEELVLLHEHGIPFEVIPGVTSAIAAPAYAGIPVTHRDYASSLHIITGHARAGKNLDIDYESLSHLSSSGTLVFLMGVENIAEITAGLLEAGIDGSYPVAVIENGTTAYQRTFVGTITELANIVKDNEVQSPAVIIVGRVADLARGFNWLPNKPLFGKKIVIASYTASMEKIERILYEKGCESILYPCADIKALDLPEVDFSLYDYLIFTSKQGVRCFFEGLFAKKKDIRVLQHIKIAAIGSETGKELNKYGFFADLMPEIFDGENLAAELLKTISKTEKLLFAGASDPSSEVLQALNENGFSVTQIPVYETMLIRNEPLELNDIDYVMLTSAFTVKGFVLSVGEENVKNIVAVCIGKQTAEAAQAYGMKTLISDISTFEGMVNLIEERVINGKYTKAAKASE